MGPLRRRDSTRVRKARSAKSLPRPRTKGDITRLKGVVKSPSQRLLADPKERLDDLRRALSLTVSVVNTCYAALEEQRCGRDLDVADVLRQCVSNRLFEQIEQVQRLIAGGSS